MAIRYTVKPVVFDDDSGLYRAASKAESSTRWNLCEWAVYENGSLGEVYKSEADARQCVADMRA